MKSQFALFIASLGFLYMTAAGVASATNTQTLPHLSLPALHTGAVTQVLQQVAEYCQSGECIPQ